MEQCRRLGREGWLPVGDFQAQPACGASLDVSLQLSSTGGLLPTSEDDLQIRLGFALREIYVDQVENLLGGIDVRWDGHANLREEGGHLRYTSIVHGFALAEKNHAGEQVKSLGGRLVYAGDDDQL